MNVVKRDGTLTYFDSKKIEQAIMKAALETGEMVYRDVFGVTVKVVRTLEKEGELHTVERIQDVVECVLMEAGFHATAKAYILYRAKRTELRNKGEK